MVASKDTTPALVAQSPLMSVIEFEGQQYFTSQYFHRQYLANSSHGSKYKRHSDFARLVRSIHAYQEYLEKYDIIELTWDRIKAEGKQDLLSWKTLFKATAHNPIMLLNATMQVALSHQLDDEISKRLSVGINTEVARQAALSEDASLETRLLERMLSLSRKQDAQAKQLAAQADKLAVLELQVTTLIDRQPPADKYRVEDWLRRHSKPFLPKDVLTHLRAACRAIEPPEMFRPEGYEYPCAYFSPDIIASAYDQVTRQLSFFARDVAQRYRP